MAPQRGSRRQQQIASNLANLRPFQGTLNADTDPETGHYVVRSYDTPIARVHTDPETGHMERHLSNQRFTVTTTQHQATARMHLPGAEGPALEEQSWTRRPVGYMSRPARSQSRTIPYRPYDPGPSRMSGDEGHGMLISELFHDRRDEEPGPRRPSRHIDRVMDL